MLYSRLCQYAIRVLVELAGEGGKQPCSAERLAGGAGVPAPTTAKVLRELVRAKLVKSFHGPGGGFTLAKPPEQINLLDIVLAIDREESFGGCLIGLPTCSDVNLCPLHPRWKELKEGISRFFQSTTLADMVDVIESRRKHLKTIGESKDKLLGAETR